MPKECPTCFGSGRLLRPVNRTWWQVVLGRSATVEESCRICGGAGVVQTEQEVLQKKTARIKSIKDVLESGSLFFSQYKQHARELIDLLNLA